VDQPGGAVHYRLSCKSSAISSESQSEPAFARFSSALQGEIKMDTATADTPDPKAALKTPQTSAKQRASPERPMDERAAARIAKKKRRRKTHRATLKRSHTGG